MSAPGTESVAGCPMTAPHLHPLPPARTNPLSQHMAWVAATTPPPVRVIRLREDHAPIVIWQAVQAEQRGAEVVQYITDREPGRYPIPEYAGHLAAKAARVARLALGVSS